MTTRFGAALVLGFAIVCGCWVCDESASAKTFRSFPAESSVVPILHKIQISQRTEEPQGYSFRAKPLVEICRGFESEIVNTQFTRDLRIGPIDCIHGKGFRERITGIVGQFISSEPSAFNLNGECLCSAEIRKCEVMIDSTIMFFRTVALLGSTKAESVNSDANYWQLNRDGGPCIEIGSIGSDAIRPSESNGKYAENDSEGRDYESRNSSNVVSVVMNRGSDFGDLEPNGSGTAILWTGGLLFGFASWFYWLTGGRGQ